VDNVLVAVIHFLLGGPAVGLMSMSHCDLP
jgi:hypothetical protein